MQRDEIKVGETYLGAKEDCRHVLGIGPQYAPHRAMTDKIWVAYELITEIPKNRLGFKKGITVDGFPVFFCSLTAFRVWAKEAVDLVRGNVAPEGFDKFVNEIQPKN